MAEVAGQEGLPSGWRSAEDAKGRLYYYNNALGKKQWVRPMAKVTGFHRQESAEPGGQTMREPPQLPGNRGAEPRLAAALGPLMHDLRPRLLWALAAAHRQQLEVVWPELARCYRPPPPDGDTAQTQRLALEARQQLARAGDIDTPQLNGFLGVARGDAAGPGADWQQSWVRLSGGCLRIDRLQSDGGSASVCLSLGPRWRVEEVAVPATGEGGSQSPGTAGFKLWQRRDDGSDGALTYYFRTSQNLKRWVLDLRTAALAKAYAALPLQQRLVEQAFQLALEGLSKDWPFVCEHLARWGTLSGAETSWEVCTALVELHRDSPGVATLAGQLWNSVQADAATVQRRAAALDRESSRQPVVDSQDALVASVRESLAPHADEVLKGQVASELQAALAGLVQPLASLWADIVPHIAVLNKLVQSLGTPNGLQPQACFAFRDTVFRALEGLRQHTVAADPDGGETAKHIRTELLPAIILAMRAVCSYIPFTDVLRAAEHARTDALGIDVELDNNPELLASDHGMLSTLPEETPSKGREGPSRTDSGSVPELSSSLQSKAVDQACRLARLVSLCQAASLVGEGGQQARLQVQRLGGIAVGALSFAADSFARALEESWRLSAGRGYSPTDAYMELDGARSARAAQEAAEAASEAALEAVKKALSLLASRWMQQLVAEVASSMVARSIAPAVARVAEQVARSTSTLEQNLLHGFGNEITASHTFGTEFVKAVLHDIVEVALQSHFSAFQQDFAQAAKTLANVQLSAMEGVKLKQSPLAPSHDQLRSRPRTLAEEWRVATDQHGRAYFWNRYTNETRWTDPRGWLAEAIEVVFADQGPLGFAVEARQEKSSLQDWMQVTRIDPGGQADRLGIMTGLMLYQVQGAAVPGLDRKSVVELFTDLRPLKTVFVQREDADFERTDRRPAAAETPNEASSCSPGRAGTEDRGGADVLDELDGDEPVETSGLNLAFDVEETAPLQDITPPRPRATTEPPRRQQRKRRMPSCCGARRPSSPTRRVKTADSSTIAQLGHLVPPTPSTGPSASPGRSRAADYSPASVPATPSTAAQLQARKLAAATVVAGEAASKAAAEEAALMKAEEEAASRAAAVAKAEAVAAAAKLTQAAEESEATIASLMALLRQHPLLPVSEPGGGTPQQPLRDARNLVENRIRSIERFQRQVNSASQALKRALWETNLDEIKSVLDAYKTLSQRSSQVQADWENLKERYDEHNAEQQELLAALQSTKVIEQAMLSDDVAAMLEVLEDHRGYDDPRVEKAWQELQERIEERQQQEQEREQEQAQEEQAEQQEQEDQDQQQEDVRELNELNEFAPAAQADLIADGFGDADPAAASVEAEMVTRRNRREARRRALSAKHNSLGQQSSTKAKIRVDIQAALRSNDVDQMVRTLARHKNSAEPEHQPLLQQLQQRVRAEADKMAETNARREARRAERRARLEKMRQEMMMKTPAHAKKPAPDLVGFREPQPQPRRTDGKTKAPRDGAGSRRGQRDREQSRSKHPDEAFLTRFDVKGSLGQGGFGEVLACWDNKRQQRVAVKVVRASGSAREGEVAKLTSEEQRRLLREASAAQKVKHANCMRCYGYYVAQDRSKFYLLLEFLAGRSLEDILLTGGPMQEVAAVQIIMGTLAGLEAVHAVNLVHRDMKPDNVIMHDRGDGVKIPKIVDFGMAKGLRSADGTALATQQFMTEGDMVAGTPEYMSPEQWAGVEKDIDFRSDIWAVGATMFQLLTGRPPYEAPPGQPRRNIIGMVMYDKTPTKDVRVIARRERVAAIKTNRPPPGDVSADVAYAVAKSLAKPLEERFSTCAEMRDALASTAAGQRGNVL